MIGVYAGELQRRCFDIGAVEGDNAMKVSLFYAESALLIHAQNYGCNFEDGIGPAIESSSFNIDNNRHVGAEAICKQVQTGVGGVGVMHHDSSATNQRSFSPAQIGTTTSLPKV